MRPLRTFLLALSVLTAPSAWGTLQAPTIALGPASIAGGASATLTITLDNNPPGNPSNITFNFTYPANVFNAATPAASTTCTGGTVSATGLGNTLSLSGASISGNNTCTVTVSITSCDQASYGIGGFNVTSSSGNPTAGTATLQVTSSSPADAAASSMSASPGSVLADGTTASTVTVTGRNFCGTTVPSGRSVSLSQGTGNSAITPASATTDASGAATFDVTNSFAETVTYSATVTTDSVVITQTTDVTFTPLNAPTVTKSFSPGTITVGGTGTLTVTITNPNNGALTGLAFTDTYPAGLVNAAAPGLSNSCAGAATAAAGGNQLALSGGLLAGMSSCSVSVSVTSSTEGSYPNSTGPVISNNALAGATASATLIVIAVSSFNVVEPGADALAGRIFTKIAGADIAVDIVALDASNNVATGFTGTVAVELVDNSGGGACAALPLVKALADQVFDAGDSGRHALGAGQFEANAYRNLRFRIKYPTASPAVTACSSDAFANRPKEFAGVQASDANRTTAGTTNVLNNTSNPGTVPVHNAGRPFQISATAQNGAGAATTLYSPDAGQPVAILAQCGAGAVCPAVTPGTLSLGAWSAAAGTITTTTATYADVGAFNLTLQDETFASVDAGDTPDSDRFIPSAAPLTVGRFVPDHFTLEAGSSITPRSDIAACATSTFTYMNERMDLVFTLNARASGGALTPSYAGATLGALVLNGAGSYNFGAIDAAAPTPLTGRLDLGMIGGVTATWAGGTANVIAPLAITRDPAPDGPYGTLGIGIAPSDPDGVTLLAAALNLDADNDATPERAQVGAATRARFGRLVMQSVYGPNNRDLPLALEAQYWDGTAPTPGFVRNSDDSCTDFQRSDFALAFTSPPPPDSNLVACETAMVEASLALASGRATITMANPGAGNSGTVRLTANLDSLGGNYCPAPGAGELPATSAARPYLLGRWDGGAAYDDKPSASAGFGVYGSQPKNFIFFRENY